MKSSWSYEHTEHSIVYKKTERLELFGYTQKAGGK